MKKGSQRKTPRYVRSQSTPSTPLKMGNVCQVAEERRQQNLKDREEANRLWTIQRDCWLRFQEDVYNNAAYLAYASAHEAYSVAWKRAHPDQNAPLAKRRDATEASIPAGFTQSFEQLRRGDANALEIPVQYLEADPWVDGSGFLKEAVIKAILRLDLRDHYVRRLQKVILAVVDKGDARREFKSYCRLATKLDTPEFRRELEMRFTEKAQINDRQEHGYWVRRRAKQVQDACEYSEGTPADRPDAGSAG